MITKDLNANAYQEKTGGRSGYSKLEKCLIAIACFNGFRLIYLIGKTVATSWIN